MKKFILEEMMLLSSREGKARKIKFSKDITVISGANSTGKSALVKSIYWSFGTNPVSFGTDWNNLDVTSLVKFRIEDKSYSIMRNHDFFALFDDTDKLIGRYHSVTKELGPVLAKLFDFNLKLNDKSGKEIVPPPAYYLVPFYIDQDKSWVSSWSSFKNLSQLPNWTKDVIDYLMGMKTDKYYELQNSAKGLDSDLTELNLEKKYLQNSLTHIEKENENFDANIDTSSFEEDMDRLVSSISKLKETREVYRQKISEKTNIRYTIESQIKIVKASLGDIESDYLYACNHAEIDCPTCGQIYTSSFAERFSIAQDESKCKDLLLSLMNEFDNINSDIKLMKIKHSEKEFEIAEISNILSAKKGKLTVLDVIKSEGRKHLHLIIQEKITYLLGRILNIESDKSKIKDTIKELLNDDKKRRKTILNHYKDNMKSNMAALDVIGLNESAYKSIYCKVEVSGSDKPRALLAYYYSVLSVIYNFSSSVFAPVIIDSPNQQDQDHESLPKMLNFINDRRINDTQLVIALTDLNNVKYEGTEIILEEKCGAMVKKEYAEVSKEMKPFIDASLLLAK